MEKVISILRRNRLAVETENAIFDAIMRWVRHDVKERQRHLKALITDCVHLNLLDERYVKVVFQFYFLKIHKFHLHFFVGSQLNPRYGRTT